MWDLKQKKITLDEARELVAHFWAKGTEWIGIYGGSGDAQFYQNVILSGIDKDGKDVTNEVTYLVLDVVEGNERALALYKKLYYIL